MIKDLPESGFIEKFKKYNRENTLLHTFNFGKKKDIRGRREKKSLLKIY